jgi:hypothetical protein
MQAAAAVARLQAAKAGPLSAAEVRNAVVLRGVVSRAVVVLRLLLLRLPIPEHSSMATPAAAIVLMQKLRRVT